MRTITRTTTACVLMVAIAAQSRADLQYEVSGGVGTTDNITRVHDDPIDENFGMVGLTAAWQEQTRRFDGLADIDLSYVEYLENDFESEIIGNADASVIFGIVPDHFTWMARDTFGQVQADPFVPVTPENRQDLNYFTTGPDFIMEFGSQNALRVIGRWSSSQYEGATLDSTREQVGLQYSRIMTRISDFGIQAIAERINFENELTPSDYDRQSAFVSYDLNAPRTEIEAQLGYTWLHREGQDIDDSPLVDIFITRNLTPSSTLAFSAGVQLTDAGDALRDSMPSGAGGLSPSITATSDPYENRHFGLEYRFQKPRTGLTLSVQRSVEEYESQTLYDRTRMNYTLAGNRLLTSALELTLNVNFTHDDFHNVVNSTDEKRFGVVLDWRLTRTFSLRFLAERLERDSDGNDLDSTENRLLLRANWFPNGPVGRQTQPRHRPGYTPRRDFE